MRRRRLDEQHEALAMDLKQQMIAHGQTIEQVRQLKKAKPPELAELPVEDRRVINLHVLAMAQFLHAHFDEYGGKAAAAINKRWVRSSTAATTIAARSCASPTMPSSRCWRWSGARVSTAPVAPGRSPETQRHLCHREVGHPGAL